MYIKIKNIAPLPTQNHIFEENGLKRYIKRKNIINYLPHLILIIKE